MIDNLCPYITLPNCTTEVHGSPTFVTKIIYIYIYINRD